MWDVRYRPMRFSDVLGQGGAVEVIQARLQKGTILDTSYLLSGGHGQGKTTLARLLARAGLCPNRKDNEPCNECDNCHAAITKTSMAIVELDAASQGTVDNMRSIVEDLPFMVPGAPKRIYIVDEAHRMSRDAQDVLLKPIEDKEMVAIFCTTEPEKIRGPIRSRCEPHQITKVTREDILERMKWVLQQEKVDFEEDAVLTVIDFCSGHVRDVLNRLEMVAQLGPVTVQSVRDRLDLSINTTYFEILLALGDTPKAVRLVEHACDRVGSEDVSTGLAESAMNAFRLANGMHADFAVVDRQLATLAHQQYGNDALLRLASFFLQNYRPTKIGLVCDVIRCAQGVPAAAAVTTVVTPVAVVAPAQASVQAAPAQAAPAQAAPASSPSPVAAPTPTKPPPAPKPPAEEPYTELDGQIADRKMPRGSLRSPVAPYAFRGTEGNGKSPDRRLIPSAQWRLEFEEAFTPFLAGRK